MNDLSRRLFDKIIEHLCHVYERNMMTRESADAYYQHLTNIPDDKMRRIAKAIIVSKPHFPRICEFFELLDSIPWSSNQKPETFEVVPAEERISPEDIRALIQTLEKKCIITEDEKERLEELRRQAAHITGREK